MGTRNLTAVFLDGEYKVAQYGQWDGYPGGQGLTCLEFLEDLRLPGHRDRFAENLRKCRWITEKEIDGIKARISSGVIAEWQDVYPELSRGTAAKILQMVYDHPEGMVLKNDISFAADSLFCEWAYVIDLDQNRFEVYKGSNNTPTDETDRFHQFEAIGEANAFGEERYYCVTMLAAYPLDELPDRDTFLALDSE